MNKQAIDALKKKLKSIGYSSRQVGVRTRGGVTHSSISVTIKSTDVDEVIVYRMANRLQDVHHCEKTHETLSGCTFVQVLWDDETLRSAKVFEVPVLDKGGSLVIEDIEGVRVVINRDDLFNYYLTYRVTGSNDKIDVEALRNISPVDQAWGNDEATKALTRFFLYRRNRLEE